MMRLPTAVVFLPVFLTLTMCAVDAQQQHTKTAAQILAENDSAVALIVSADEENVSLGSGFFVRDGTVLVTNFHVIEGAQAVAARLKDGRIMLAAHVAGYDLENDLALLRMEESAGTTVTLGDSDLVAVGETVVVISNPQGLEHTVSNGLISGSRAIEGGTLFQITAPISSGSSGGPVFNEKGSVIGVVRAYLKDGQNLNFAIPVNSVKRLLAKPRIVAFSELPTRRGHGKELAGINEFEGAWSGTFADSLASGQLVANLVVQDSGEVIGTYTSSLGGGGRIVGRVTSEEFRFELVQSLKDCPGSFVATGPMRGGTMVGSYSGSDCQGFHSNGTFILSKGSAPMSPPVAAAESVAKPLVEYGSESELADARTVFVYAEDLEVRENIMKELRKYKVISITNDPALADVFLVFGGNSFSLGDYTYVWRDYYGNVHGTTTPRYGVTGTGIAAKIERPNTIRIVWTFQDTRTTLYERRPSTNFARNFIKVMKRLKR